MIDLPFLENYRDTYIIGKLDYRYLTHKKTDLSMDTLISDVHNGLKTLHDTVQMNGITVNKVIMMGSSLGATLALLYTYTFLDVNPIPIAFCVTMSGLTDLTDAMTAKTSKRFGKRVFQNYLLSLASILVEEELSSNDITKLGYSDKAIESFKKISPIYYVNENAPPVIIVHNANDKVIPFSNGISLAYVLEAYNVPHIFIQSLTSYGHRLGPNIRNRNGLVFAPPNARSPVKTPKRYTRKLHPLLEEKLVESMNQYIEEYCLEQ
jgi:acetyl esterase/lipase